MNSLGIYFGIKDINLVESSGKKIVNNIRLPHPSTAMAELEDKVPVDIKLIAMLKDSFRTYRIKAEEVFFCISGQDLVIRTFEIPLIPKNELKGVVSFEAKKYIPFKLDELDYDFKVLFNKKNKTSLVLFVGIKKEILDNYISIAKQLNLKVGVLEYSGFSILRFLKLAGLSDNGVLASLCFDLNNEDEANFTVFENGFSLFSRDFVLTTEPQGFEQAVQVDLSQRLEKLKNEIRISFDYYKRKFPEKNIKEIFVISNKESHQELGSFFTESSITARFVETQKLLGKEAAYSSMLVKSFAVSLFKSAPLNIKIDLIGTKLKAVKAVGIGVFQPLALLEGIKLDFKYIIAGIVICVAVFGYGLMRIIPIQEEIAGIKSKRMKISTPVVNDNIEELTALSAKYRKKIKTLDNLIKNQVYVTYPLDAIPKAIPKGAWLDSFSFNKKNDGSLELVLNGQVYLENNEKEFETVSILLENLKNDQVFAKYFKEIAISSIDRKTDQEKSVTVFTIVCKNFPEKK